jgi:hypothetical protein
MPKSSSINDVNIFIPMKTGGNTNTLYISIISIFIIFSLIVYLKPELFISIFGSLLGNIFLIGLVLGLSFYHMKSAIAVGLFFFMLVLIVRRSDIQKITGLDSDFDIKEGFADNTNNTVDNTNASDSNYSSTNVTIWSPTLVDEFVKFQKVLNPDVTYDMNIVQKQANPDEVSYLFKNNKWPWSEKVQTLYKEAVAQNSFIHVDPGISMINAQQIYNENAMKQMLSYNTKEGTFLLYGAIVGHNKNLPSNINNTVMCSTNAKGDSILEKIVYNGYDSIYGSMNTTVTEIDYNDLPSEVNGFKFLGAPCDPCVALKTSPEYTCPFALNTGNGYDVSPIWQMLWNVTPETVKNTTTKNSEKSNSFPVLSQLKNEINKLDFISKTVVNTGVSSNTTGSTTGTPSTSSTTTATNAAATNADATNAAATTTTTK